MQVPEGPSREAAAHRAAGDAPLTLPGLGALTATALCVAREGSEPLAARASLQVDESNKTHLVAVGTLPDWLGRSLAIALSAQRTFHYLPAGAAHVGGVFVPDVKGDVRAHELARFLLDGHTVDYAFVEGGRRWSDVGLAALDMDGTLSKGDSPTVLLKELGLWELEKRLRTARDEAGIPKFDPQNKRDRVRATLAGVEDARIRQIAAQHMREANMHPGAGRLLGAFAEDAEVWLVSGTYKQFTDVLVERHGLTGAVSVELALDAAGVATGDLVGEPVVPSTKAAFVRAKAAELPPGKTVVAVADGFNDGEMFDATLELGGTPIAYRAKDEAVRSKARVVIDHAGVDAVRHFFVP